MRSLPDKDTDVEAMHTWWGLRLCNVNLGHPSKY